MRHAPDGAGRYDQLHGDEDMRDELDTERVLNKLADMRERHALELASLTHSQLLERMSPYEQETVFHALLRRWYYMIASSRVVKEQTMRDHHLHFCRDIAEFEIDISEAENEVIRDMQSDGNRSL